MTSSYRQELENWLSQLDVKADNVLDIGGAQNPVKGRTKSWDVKEYLIADLPKPHKDSAKPDIKMDLNKFHALPIGFVQFDLIFCLEVFEYIYNPAIAFGIISTYLKEGGTAWISFPSIYPLHQPIEDDSLRYMPAGIEKLATSVGLKTTSVIKRRPRTNLLQQFYSAEGMRAAKGEDLNFTGFIVCFKK